MGRGVVGVECVLQVFGVRRALECLSRCLRDRVGLAVFFGDV